MNVPTRTPQPAVHPPPLIPLRVPFDCEVVAVSELTASEKLLRLRLADGAWLGQLPGQFVQVSLLGWGEAPISVASSPTREGYFELGVRRAGTLTGAMHLLAVGDVIGIRGPFGRPFELPRLRGQDLLLISGGCGLAPMRSLIQYCEDRREEFGRLPFTTAPKAWRRPCLKRTSLPGKLRRGLPAAAPSTA